MAGGDRAARLAAVILEFRKARSDALPSELFSEPAWDLLLELFIADAQGVRLTGREVSRRRTIPPTVLSRWLLHLSKSGLVVGDGRGDLDDQLTLSGAAFQGVEAILAEAVSLQKDFYDAEDDRDSQSGSRAG